MAKDIVRTGLFGEESRRENARPDRNELARYLSIELKDVSLEQFASAYMMNPIQMALEYFDLRRGQKTCQRMSLIFNPHRFDIPTIKDDRSIYASFKDPKFADGLARFLMAGVESNRKVSDKGSFWTALEVGVQGIQYANEFPPHVARDLCKQYGLHRDSKVLDPCAGWGGRMIGVSVVSDHYIGYEPATRTAFGLKRLADKLTEYNPSFEARVFCKPYEDAQVPKNIFDFAITSPPYFDTERYSNEDTQSYIRYPTFNKWAKGFFSPMIHKTMRALKPDGVFVVNIGSRVYKINELLALICKRHGYKLDRVGMRNKKPQLLSGKGGLGKSGEGETFYELRK